VDGSVLWAIHARHIGRRIFWVDALRRRSAMKELSRSAGRASIHTKCSLSIFTNRLRLSASRLLSSPTEAWEESFIQLFCHLRRSYLVSVGQAWPYGTQLTAGVCIKDVQIISTKLQAKVHARHITHITSIAEKHFRADTIQLL
jgi:hypothetical protein